MKRYSILLIEDDELDIISVERSLKKSGKQYELHTAYNGTEALALLKGAKNPLVPDIILLDLNMPKMNGIEFLTVLRSDDLLKNIRVFVMTTTAEDSERKQLLRLGISGYIIKPLSYNDNTKNPDAMEAFFQFHLRKILVK